MFLFQPQKRWKHKQSKCSRKCLSFFFGLFCFFSKRTAVLGLLMHPGNCKHSPLDNSLGYCYVPVTIASGHEAGIQQPCSENIILLLHSCSNTSAQKSGAVCCFIPALPAGKLRHGVEMWFPRAAEAEPCTDLLEWGVCKGRPQPGSFGLSESSPCLSEGRTGLFLALPFSPCGCCWL